MKKIIFLTIFVMMFAINVEVVSAEGNFLYVDSSVQVGISTATSGMETITFWKYFTPNNGSNRGMNMIYTGGIAEICWWYQEFDRDYTIRQTSISGSTATGSIELPGDGWYFVNLDIDWDAMTAQLTLFDNTQTPVSGSIDWSWTGEYPNAGNPMTFDFDGGTAIDNWYSSVNGGDNFELYQVGNIVWNGRIEDGTGASGISQAPSGGEPVGNTAPDFISASDNGTTIKGGSTLQITTTASDTDSETLKFRVCSTNAVTGSACSGTEYCNNIGSLSNPSCSFATLTDNALHTWYAFLFDVNDEPSVNNPRTGTYTTDSTAPTGISLTSVEGDSGAPYIDKNADSNTNIVFSVTGATACKWATTDIAYSAMSNSCGSTSSCTFTGINLEQSYTHHISCIDAVGNENTNANNLDVTWTNIFPFIITIESPENNTHNTSSVWFNATVDKDVGWCGYSLDGATNITMTNSSGNWNANNNSMTDGNHSVIFYCNDTANMVNSTNPVYFTIDTIPPSISFIAPTEDDNKYLNKNQTYLNWSILEINPDTTILNWNGANMTLTNTSVNFTDLTDDTYTYYLWANDTIGNSNQTEIRTLTIDTINPSFTDILTNFITSTSAIITWISDALTTSTIYYGTDINTTQNASNSTFVVNNSFTLTDLSSSTLYYYNVSSCDQAGNCNISDQYNFTTLAGFVCGDSTCNNGETCSTCATDCGSCTSTGGSHSFISPTVTVDTDESNETIIVDEIDNTTINSDSTESIESNQTLIDNITNDSEEPIITETEALNSIESLETTLAESETNGYTLNEEVNNLLTLAREAFKDSNYDVAYNLAKDAETILNDEQQTIITPPKTKQTISYRVIFAALSVILVSIIYLKKTELLMHRKNTSNSKGHSANIYGHHSSDGAFFSYNPFNTKSDTYRPSKTNHIKSRRIYTQSSINTRVKQIIGINNDYKNMHKVLDTRLKTLKRLHSKKK